MQPNKKATIKGATDAELRALVNRLRLEREAQDVIQGLRRHSGEYGEYGESGGNHFVSTETPIEDLYHTQEAGKDFLAHYGILGMKWGVRRYQNKDGSLTAAGKKHQARVASSREEGLRVAKDQSAQKKKGVGAANALVSAEKKAKTGVVDKSFLNNPNISQKAKDRVSKTAERARAADQKKLAAAKKEKERVDSSREEGLRVAAERAQVKAQKEKRKADIANARQSIEQRTSVKERMVYNNATRARAAKYVVDRNMTVSEAIKKSKSDAWRNTSILLAAYGALTYASIKHVL